MTPELQALFAVQHGVATTWQVIDVVGDGRLRTLLRRGVLTRLRRGVLAVAHDAALLDPAARAALEARATVLLCRREETVAGVTAAVVHGLPVLGRLPDRPRLAIAREVGERPREDRPRTWYADGDVVEIDGLPVTALARTVVDVARTRPFAFAVVTADAALARGLLLGEALQVLERCRRWPGARSARRALAFADGRSESPLESLGRARCEEQGLPRPELQVELGDASRSVRVDHYWRAQRTVGEADGLGKYTSADVLRREKLREDRLREDGLQVVRYVWDEALRSPELVAERFRRAFARGLADRGARSA